VKVVISQSMLFPWAGMLEQMRLADVFVHYDDVQYSKGSFTNRVQVKLPEGSRWMTVPLRQHKLGQAIDEASIQPVAEWRDKHLSMLAASLDGAPHVQEAMKLAQSIYAQDHESIGQLARASMTALADYFGLLDGKRVIDVRTLELGGAGSQRVLDIVKAVGGTTYITGHGARNYLDHAAFESAGVAVQYMRYQCKPYPQSWGDFNPYVTGLDLIANCGLAGLDQLCSQGVDWRSFLAEA
jgi:hypothetical protein